MTEAAKSIDISSITDVHTLRSKRGGQKGSITRIRSFQRLICDKELKDVSLVELQRKRDALDDHMQQYEAIHDRLAELLSHEQLEPDEAEQEYQQQFSYDLGKELNLLIDAITAWKLSATIQTSLDDFQEREVVLTASGRTLYTKLWSDYVQFMDMVKHLPHADLTKARDGLTPLVIAVRKRFDDESASLESTKTPSDKSTTTESPMATSSKLKINLPRFSGDQLEWRDFWRQFKPLIDRETSLSEAEKICHLVNAMAGEEAKRDARVAAGTYDKFEEVVKELRSKYDQPRVVYRSHVHQLCTRKGHIEYTHKGLQDTASHLKVHLSGLERHDGNTLPQFLAALTEQFMSEETLRRWNEYTASQEAPPTINNMIQFLSEKSRTLGVESQSINQHQSSRSRDRPPRDKPPSTNQYNNKRSGRYSSSLHVNAPPPCRCCNNGDHFLYQCQRFRGLTLPQRQQALQSIPACYNCLGTDHSIRQCPSKRTCKECNRKHHTLLHSTYWNSSSSSNATTTDTSSIPTPPTLPTGTNTHITVPDRTALIWSCQTTLEVDGHMQKVRAMIDTGSTLSFLTSRMANRLKARRIPCPTTVSGLDQSHAATSKYRVDVNLKIPEAGGITTLLVSPSLVTSITGDTPSIDLTNHQAIEFTKKLKLADPDFGSPGQIDLLLGQDMLPRLLRSGMVNSPTSNLYGLNTIFGWVIGGNCTSSSQAATAHICVKACSATDTNDLLKAFWETEEPPSNIAILSPEEKSAVDQFTSTVSREDDGRYIVKLPKREDTPTLGHSRTQALKRYDQNKRSLERKGNWQAFCDVLDEYPALGHSELVPEADLQLPDSQAYYLPMHGVVKASSTSTKLRAVFDASAITSTGISLNHILLPGPSLYPLLTNILIKFRTHTIGMSADISKMFREVTLHPSDRDLHRYVTRDDTGKAQDWRMTRVTFGVTSSPFLATQVLRQLAQDYECEFPEAAALVRSSFYVDDCLTGADDLKNAIHIREALNDLLSKARMSLRKWRTNSTELKSTIPEELLEKEESQLIQAPSTCHKALGVHWNTSSDALHVATPDLDKNDQPTKRQVLSDIARTFDVLGWFSPVTISLKIMLQKIWHLGMDWDQLIPPDLANIWQTWRSELPSITAFPVPRCYFHRDRDRINLQIHGFCDASLAAYAGVVYLRAVYDDTSITTSMVVAKAKVAPVKPQTVPRLELNSAVLLSKLLTTVKEQLGIDPSNIHAWSDSTIALTWIQTPPHNLKTFVANRVVAITDILSPSHWRHVASEENPADLGSRGITTGDLIQSSLWWSGPPWLSQPPDQWPISKWEKPRQIAELKTSTLAVTITPEVSDLTARFSDYKHMVKVMTWVYEFVDHTRKKKQVRVLTAPLTAPETQTTENRLFRLHQQQYFSTELTSLKRKNSVPTTSNLQSLQPFLDEDGLIRVGGRLKQSDLPFSQRHPIIMHQKSHLVRILVKALHHRLRHAGPTLMMAALSHEYFILGARRLVRNVSRKCITCQKSYARTGRQVMGELPASRITPAPPFTNVGMDFAGPVLLKKGHTRKPTIIKAYICLFVCLATKATHLELVSDLSTSAFLAAFRRFAARRGCPTKVWSDNGTNFVGAHRELTELHRLLENQTSTHRLQHFFSGEKITWKFSPGRAPHFGGLWEAAVKSAKTLLRKLLGTHTLTWEEYASVLSDVEAVLNSRPLCPIDSLPEDGLSVLTPGHFLIGRPLTAPPQPTLDELSIPSRKRWNLCLKISTEFWQRWTSEYLQTLQRRNKWRMPQRDFRVGDIVLIKDQDLFVRSWPLARILNLHPGKDGHVRTVTIQTSKGIYLRPIVKLVLLVPEDEEEKDQEKDKASASLPGRGEDVQAEH